MTYMQQQANAAPSCSGLGSVLNCGAYKVTDGRYDANSLLDLLLCGGFLFNLVQALPDKLVHLSLIRRIRFSSEHATQKRLVRVH